MGVAARGDEERAILAARGADLEEAFIVSAVTVREGFPGGDEEFVVDAGPAEGEKCQRCWRWRTDVGTSADHPDLCAECAETVG